MKSNKKIEYKKFNTKHLYQLPMVPNDKKNYIENEEVVITNIEQDNKGFVTIRKEGYQTKRFPDLSFEWYLWNGYIKEVK